MDPKLRCKKCNGRKVNRERKILEVAVDKGMEDGQKVTFSGEGDQEPGLEPGDIIIVLDEKAHSVFKRNGQDLVMKMDINLTEALTGLKKTIKTLDERTLVIQTVRGEAALVCVNIELMMFFQARLSRPETLSKCRARGCRNTGTPSRREDSSSSSTWSSLPTLSQA